MGKGRRRCGRFHGGCWRRLQGEEAKADQADWLGWTDQADWLGWTDRADRTDQADWLGWAEVSREPV